MTVLFATALPPARLECRRRRPSVPPPRNANPACRPRSSAALSNPAVARFQPLAATAGLYNHRHYPHQRPAMQPHPRRTASLCPPGLLSAVLSPPVRVRRVIAGQLPIVRLSCSRSRSLPCVPVCVCVCVCVCVPRLVRVPLRRRLVPACVPAVSALCSVSLPSTRPASVYPWLTDRPDRGPATASVKVRLGAVLAKVFHPPVRGPPPPAVFALLGHPSVVVAACALPVQYNPRFQPRDDYRGGGGGGGYGRDSDRSVC